MGQDQTRNSKPEVTAHAQGVGARHEDPSTPPGGGGYQDICKKCEISHLKKNDPRLKELKKMAIPRVWMYVAESEGVDTFLNIWSILSSDRSVQGNSDRVYIPRLSKYRRYQRNRLIMTLHEAGEDPGSISIKIRQQLGDKMSPDSVTRCIKKNRNR